MGVFKDKQSQLDLSFEDGSIDARSKIEDILNLSCSIIKYNRFESVKYARGFYKLWVKVGESVHGVITGASTVVRQIDSVIMDYPDLSQFKIRFRTSKSKSGQSYFVIEDAEEGK